MFLFLFFFFHLILGGPIIFGGINPVFFPYLPISFEDKIPLFFSSFLVGCPYS